MERMDAQLLIKRWEEKHERLANALNFDITKLITSTPLSIPQNLFYLEYMYGKK